MLAGIDRLTSLCCTKRNGWHDRYRAMRTSPGFPPRVECRPLPCVSIPDPPVAHSRSHWWHRPKSRSSRTRVHLETSDVDCHRCPTAFPESDAVDVAVDADLVAVEWLPIPRQRGPHRRR